MPIRLHRNPLPYLGSHDFSRSGSMTPTQSRQDSHQKEVEQSTTRLQKAWDDAFKKRGYQSSSTWATLHAEFCHRNPGKVPYSWQVDIREVLHLGLDCVVIAGTGAGKTMPFVMPLFLDPKKNPLNALEEDQVNIWKKGSTLRKNPNSGSATTDKVTLVVQPLRKNTKGYIDVVVRDCPQRNFDFRACSPHCLF